jgi:hypothetical protein
LNIVRKRMPDGIHGETDGSTIWVDDRLDEVQVVCTIQHELIHIERGHRHRQPEEVETEVRYETARRLLPIEAMVGKCRFDVELTARMLMVTPRVLMDRAATLTDEEAKEVGCNRCRACPTAAFRFQAPTASEPVGA